MTDTVPEILRDILVCPHCRENLQYKKEGENAVLVCPKCGENFEVSEGIPNFIRERGQN